MGFVRAGTRGSDGDRLVTVDAVRNTTDGTECIAYLLPRDVERVALDRLRRCARDRFRIEDAVLRFQRGAIREILANPSRIDRAIDHNMRDVNSFRAELLSHALRQRAQRVFCA